jgi:hypothetical protein
MAVIPGIAQLGGWDTNGGRPGLRAGTPAGAANLDPLFTLGDAESREMLPKDVNGESASASLSWWPWWDDAYSATTYTLSAPTTTTVQLSGPPTLVLNAHAGQLITVRSAAVGDGFECRGLITSNTTGGVITCSAGFTKMTDGTSVTPTNGYTCWIADTGGFTDFHPSVGHTTIGELIGGLRSTRGGAAVSSNGTGVGIEGGLLRELLANVYTSDPYFVYWKLAIDLATGQGWSDAGSTQTALEAKLARVKTGFAAKYPSDTLSWDLCIFQNNKANVARFVTNFAEILDLTTDTQALATWLRSASMFNNSAMKIILVNDDNEIDYVDAPGYQGLVNRVNKITAAADANMAIVDAAGLPMRAADPSLGLASENREFYSAQSYFRELPKRIRIGYQRMIDGIVVASASSIPTYLMVGDSIWTGPISEAFTTQLNSPIYTAAARANQYVYNRLTGVGEPYDAHENGNTSGTAGTPPNACGPEFSLMALLADIHPDGFLVIKRGSSGSSLVTAAATYASGSNGVWVNDVSNENWDEFALDFSGAAIWANNTLGKQLDVRAFLVSLGTNDASNGLTNSGTAFATTLPTFVDDLRTAYGTRGSNSLTPVIWRRPQRGLAARDDDEVVLMRDALDALALADPMFTSLDVDTLQRDATDNLHETDAASLIDGELLFGAIRALAF